MNLVWNWLWRLGPGNPMVIRIVQGGSRRGRHLAVRVGYLGAMIMLVVLGLMSGQGMGEASLTQLAKAGTIIFERVAFGQIILICLLAPLFMSGAIASERSGNTYEILLSTPLSNLQIVLGSLFGRMFFVLALLASGIPLFSIVLILGGVPVSNVFISFAIAALSAVLVGVVAVTLSTMRTGGRKAVVIFVISVAGYLLGSYMADVLLIRKLAAVPGQTTWLTPLHPLLVLEAEINRANYTPPAVESLTGYSSAAVFYLSRPLATFTLLSSGLSLVLITWCAVRLRAVGQDESLFKKFMRKAMKATVGERRRAPREVWHNPVAWREANTRGKLTSTVIARWSFVVIAIGAGVLLLVMYHTNRLPVLTDPSGMKLPPHDVFHYALMSLLLFELAIISMVAIYMSAGCISREREDGTLDLMLTTPITPKHYIWGKLRGLVSFLTMMLAVPVVTLAIVSVYCIVGSIRKWPQVQGSFAVGGGQRVGEIMIPEAPLLMALMLVPFVAACVMVGMSWSIKSKGVLAAVTWSVAIIGGLSLLMGWCGFSAAQNVPVIGPVINAFSPATNTLMILNPWSHVRGFADNPAAGRINLFIAASLAAGGYSLLVYTLLLGIVRNFDQTVRKLSGTG